MCVHTMDSCEHLLANGRARTWQEVSKSTPNRYMYICIHAYIDVYTCSCVPVHPIHENVRLCAERHRLSWSCQVRRFWSSGTAQARAAIWGPTEPRRFERQCKAPSDEPSVLEVGNTGMRGVFEQPDQAISSALAEPSEFEQVRVAISSASAEPSGLSGHRERPRGAERARSWKRRQAQCFRAARPSNFKRPG